jgi:hypothetical protein
MPTSRLAYLGATCFALAACASTGATFQSGVGDAFLERAPYYAGSRLASGGESGARVGVLPLYYQPGAGQPDPFDPRREPGSPISTLLAEMNEALDSLTASEGLTPLGLGEGVRGTVAPAALGTPPDVRFGCLTELDLPGEDCAERGDSVLGREDQRMKLAVGRPAAQWISATGSAMDAAGLSHVLVLTLEVGQYLPKQKGLAGRKSVELGTGYEVEFPWLTSLETPVAVLQLTGALMDRNGKAVRIGAEGIVARRTRLPVSALEAQELLGDADVAAARTQRREDLAGAPLAWREAMEQLVTQLVR